MNNISINFLKNNNQDFEWYPTTYDMIMVIKNHSQKLINKRDWEIETDAKFSILDIGCGDGRVSNIISCGGKKYIIEKSDILRTTLNHEFIPVGIDFHATNLMCLNKVDIIFCNPPYSEFTVWVKKILLECNGNNLYLIIPERWINNNEILNIIKERDIEYTIIHKSSFENAERQARCNVNIIYFNLNNKKKKALQFDPFAKWYNETFKKSIEKCKNNLTYHDSIKNKLSNNKEIIISGNHIDNLAYLYNTELMELHQAFITLNNLPDHIFNLLDISQSKISNILKENISTLKNIYWNELFNKYKPLQTKLTSYGKKILLDELINNISIDFTIDNIYAITIWAIKQSNNLFDQQLVDLMDRIINFANIKLYKSNNITFNEEKWRWSRFETLNDKNFKYYLNLELRIILEDAGHVTAPKGYKDYYYPNNLHIDSNNLIDDILIVARNLGFSVEDVSSLDKTWSASKKEYFYLKNGDILLEAKAYHNGNFHLKLNVDFLKAFNIEFGRIKKWIKNKKDVSSEMDISNTDAEKYFNCTNKLELNTNIILLNE